MESSTLRHNGPDDDRPESVTVAVDVRPEAVVRARTTVARAAADASLQDDRIDDLVIAVSEAVTNAIESQLRIGDRSPIEVTCRREASMFEVAVIDRGDGFVPEALAVRPPVASPHHLDIERGWGIQLMRELVDEVVFDITGPGTCVRLRMSLG
jgi:serine/threonine-protein kinase RsbW